jgi:hypothetical protein
MPHVTEPPYNKGAIVPAPDKPQQELKPVQYHPSYCAEAREDALKKEGRLQAGHWDTSHGLSIITPSGRRVRIGQFQHARWAQRVGELIREHGLGEELP